jgi:CBS domain containing-hemolysin-like protein
MEDVMEEIFGEIEDELDEQTEIEQQEDETTWLLSARLEVDYLNDKYDWDLPTGEYESLGGLVVDLHQDLPEQGEIIEAPPFRFEVVGMEETRITLLRLTFPS